MSLQVGELYAKLRLDDTQFNQGLNRIPGVLRGVGTAAVAASATIAAALGGAAIAGLHEFAGLQRGMNEVFTLLPGISGQAMDRMTSQVRGLATELGVVPDQIVPALYQALSAGVPPDNVFAFLEQANQAAVGGVTDLTTAVDGITSVVNAYGDRISGAAEASDLMFTAVRLGKTTFEELSASLSNVTPIAAANGVAFEQITAAIASMTAQGIPTAQATTQIRQAIVELSDAGSQVGGVFEQVAGVSFRQFMEEGGTLAEVLAMLEQHAAASGISVDQLFGSVEAGGAALALGGANAAGFAANLEEMAASAGATQAAYETMDQGISRAWDRIKAAGQVLLGHLGEELAPAFEQLASWLIDNMPAIQENVVGAFRAIGEFIRTDLLPAFQSVAAWWDDNGPAIIEAAGIISDAVADAFAVIADAATAAADWLRATFGRDGQSTATLREFAVAATAWGRQIVEIISTSLETTRQAVERITAAIRWVWDNFGAEIAALTRIAWETIRDLISGVLDIIQGLQESFAALYTGDWRRLWDGVRQIADGVWTLIVAIFRSFWDQLIVVAERAAAEFAGRWAAWVRGLADRWAHFTGEVHATWNSLWDGIAQGWGAIQSRMEGLFRGLVGSLGAIWDGVRNAMAAPVNWVAEHVINGLIGAVNTVARALGAGDVARPLSTPLVPTFHEGGVVGRGGRLTPLLEVGAGERIVKVRDGEEVLTPDDPRHADREGIAGDPESPGVQMVVPGASAVPRAAGPRGLLGSLGQALSNAAYAVLDQARQLIADTIRPALEGLADLAASGAERFGPAGRLAGAAGRKVVDQALDWLSGVSDDLEEAIAASGLGRALEFARAQAGKPYVWGGVGPGGYDCSGFLSAIANVALGRPPHSRIFTTSSIIDGGGAGPFRPGGGGDFSVGAFKGNPGHAAGTLLGVDVESRGGRGSVVGAGARGADHPMFTHQFSLRGLADGGLVTRPTAALVGEAGPELVIPLSKLGTGAVGGRVAVTLQEVWDGVLADVTAATSTWGRELLADLEETTTGIAGLFDTAARSIATSLDSLDVAAAALDRSAGGAATTVDDLSAALERLVGRIDSAFGAASAASAPAVAAAGGVAAPQQPPPVATAEPGGAGEGVWWWKPQGLPGGKPEPGRPTKPSGPGAQWGSAFVSAVRAGVR